MGSRTQILKCKVLLKGIEFDFALCKELKIDWKLPKIQFSIFSITPKIKNWIENCPQSIFISLKLLKLKMELIIVKKIYFQFFSLSEKLKIELKIVQNQFSFFSNYWKLN